MAFYANQNSIKIKREIPDYRGKKQYLSAYSENIAAAARLLNGVPFKFYIYLLSNQDGYSFDYSPKHFSNIYGVSYDSAKKAIAPLVDAGFLVKNPGGGYEFYEVPQEKPKEFDIVLPEQEKRLAPLKGGIFEPITYIELYQELTKQNIPESKIEEYWNKMEVAK